MEGESFLTKIGLKNKNFAYFINEYKPDLRKIGLENHPLKSKNGIVREPITQIYPYYLEAILGKGNFYAIYLVCDGSKTLLAETIDTSNFFELACFLDQYEMPRSLPDIVPPKYSRMTASEIFIAMDIVRRGDCSQESFVALLEEAENKILKPHNADYSYLDYESFNGIESAMVTLSGKPSDESSSFVKYDDAHKCWEIFYRERGTLYLEIRFFSIKYVYKYLLNSLLHAV